ncbi:MAG TPA: sigma-54 dependent transcriptional regulator [Verrucomicrobiae bacterium]|nr:sigma-54 dependent transcriptional regulator [Verrucomicrobiae bacterium]
MTVRNAELDYTAAVSDPPAAQAIHVLVVDDDPIVCQQLERLYAQEGYRVTTALHVAGAQELLQNEDIDLVVTDVRLEGPLDGVALTRLIAERWSDIPVIVITAYADIETAVEVLKIGASDYLVKPLSAATLQESTRAVLEKARLFTGIRELRRHLKEHCEFGGMLSRTAEMHQVFETIRLVAPTDSTVVVEGETGTGKELVASAIHHQSPRWNGPFVTINCGGVPESLLESELFGHERGAFTGADQPRAGKIELADGGTLFLDEIENMSLTMQAKLLLVLQSQKVQRLGGNRWTRVGMRVIAATNVPLRELVRQGRMRNDFYYRISVIPIRLLPLRQRLEDIPLLVQDYLRHHPVAKRKRITDVTSAALDHLMRYSWPGNVRELQNVLEKAVILTKSRTLNASDLQLDRADLAADAPVDDTKVPLEVPLNEWIHQQEKAYLVHKLKSFGGRIDLTAKSSGVDVRTIHRKMQLYGLDKRKFDRKALPAVTIPITSPLAIAEPVSDRKP